MPMLLEAPLVPLLGCQTPSRPCHPHSSPQARRMRMTGSRRWQQLCFGMDPRTPELSTFERHQEVSPRGWALEEEQEQQELTLLNRYQ